MLNEQPDSELLGKKFREYLPVLF